RQGSAWSVRSVILISRRLDGASGPRRCWTKASVSWTKRRTDNAATGRAGRADREVKEDVDHEPRRCTIGARQAGRHPVDAAQRGTAQGVAARAGRAAAHSRHARALSVEVREVRARP